MYRQHPHASKNKSFSTLLLPPSCISIPMAANSHPVQELINVVGSSHPAIHDSLPRLSDIITQSDRLPSQSHAQSLYSSSLKPQRPKFKRSRAGCLTCRKRKVKCDMTTPVCLKCTSLGRECTYPNPNTPHSKKRTKSENSQNSHHSHDQPESSAQPDNPASDHQNPFENPTRSLLRLQTLLGTKLLSQLIQSAPQVKLEDEQDNLNLPSIGENSLPAPSTGSSMPLLGAPPQPSFFDPASSRILPPNLDPALVNPGSLSTVSVPFNSFNSESDGLVPPMSPITNEYGSFLSSTPFFSPPSPALNQDAGPESEYIYNKPSPKPSPPSAASSTGLPPIMSEGVYSNNIINANPQSRQLLHNFLSQSKKLLCAINEPKNPFLALSIPLVLNTNQSAITYGILAISATHMHFIRQKQGLDAEQELQLSKQLKNMALKQVMMPLMSDTNMHDIDMSLLAFIAVLKYDVLSASQDWRQSMNVALALVAKLGGPPAMLGMDRNAPGASRKKIDEATKKSLLIRRTFLEELTAHEVFACLTTGDTPQLIGNDSAWWWFEMMNVDSITPDKYDGGESFERSYGMSRTMLDIIARSCRLHSERRKLNMPIPIDDAEAEALKGVLPIEVLGAMQSLRSQTFAMYSELENMTKQSVVLRHQRVECGDLIYRHTLMIFLSREIFDIPIQEPSIQSAARAVLGLCSEATRDMGMAVMLIWAIIISGVQMYREDDREWVNQLFRSCREWYCLDLECAEKIVRECWNRFDRGAPNQDWRSVARDLQIDVMML
ncbi:hypothetical protein E3P99_01623 [Wallemia hederae]|uniref:Zn(2)-C6 fungal-type domain-containing protein n=1 Tax=Wallemia hederae TaxID=1540922 RepID=A0A4T0FPD5_9BASI|nr:hypothetical protein E3P99_01623 [Wallemia hederae]